MAGIAARLRLRGLIREGAVRAHVGGEESSAFGALFGDVLLELGPIDVVLQPVDALLLAEKLKEAALAAVDREVHGPTALAVHDRGSARRHS